MNGVYRLMSEQAQSWSDSWDATSSKARKPIWGSSYEIFNPPHPAHDQTLPLPSAPGADLQYRAVWSEENARRIDLAATALDRNDVLLGLLYDNLRRSQFNRFNLEVYLTIASLCRQNFSMILGIHEMDLSLAVAAKLKDDPAKALKHVDEALDRAAAIWQMRNAALDGATRTWYRGWFPVVPEANGRRFLDEVDDVKDHLPGRTSDMTYLVYREKLLPFGEWVNAIAESRNQFAVAHHLPAREYHLAWQDFAVTSTNTATNAAAQ
jgi:hexosaminidase